MDRKAHEHAPQCRAGLRRPFPGRGWLAALPAAWLAWTPAEAAVEFVTPVGSCTVVDRIGDNKDLRVAQGTLEFEVWGSGVDMAVEVGTRLTINGGGGVTATIREKRSGPQNLAGPCRQATGSVRVRVVSDQQQADFRRTLMFPMPFGGSPSPLAVTFRAQRPFAWTWSDVAVTEGIGCLIPSVNSYRVDLNSKRLTIDLPPGARNDTSNCTAALNSAIRIDQAPSIDVDAPFSYQISGQPGWLTQNTRSLQARGLAVRDANGHPRPAFNVNVLELRRITRPGEFRLTAGNSNGRTDTLTLVVNPGPENGIQSVVCGSGNRISAGQNFLCEVRFAASVPQGEIITYQSPSQACFLDSAGQPLSQSNGFGRFSAPTAGTLQRVPLTHVPGRDCGGQLGATTNQLRLNFWRGDTGTTGQQEGPDFATLVVSVQ